MDNQTEAREENKFDISNKSLQKEEPSIVEQSEVQEEPSMQPEVQEEPFIIEQPEVQEALQNTPTEEEITSRPQRNKHPPRYLENYECYLSHSNLPIEPSNHRQALKDPRWINAMEEELKALHLNQTWSLVPRPEGTNVISSKWIFRVKQREDGSVERFKARLVARGFTQVSGLDYEETYCPVIRHTTIRLVIALGTSLNWSMRQLDVKKCIFTRQAQGDCIYGTTSWIHRSTKTKPCVSSSKITLWTETSSTSLV